MQNFSSFTFVSSSRESPSLCVSGCVKSLSPVWLCVTPWTAAHQASLFVGFCRQEYWSGLPFPSPGTLPDSDPGIKPGSSSLQEDFLLSEPLGGPSEFMMTPNKIHCLNASQPLYLVCKESTAKQSNWWDWTPWDTTGWYPRDFSKAILTLYRRWRGICVSCQESIVCKGFKWEGAWSLEVGTFLGVTQVNLKLTLWVVSAERAFSTWPLTWCSQDAWLRTTWVAGAVLSHILFSLT